MNKKIKKEEEAQNQDESSKFPLPIYDKEDDIYSRAKEEHLENEEVAEKKKVKTKEKNLGEDLDIPGSELDDEDEAIGEEDEENNYYSLGGDNHEDLEEDKG